MVEDYDFLSSSQSLLIDPPESHKFPITARFRTLNVRIIHNVATHVLIPWTMSKIDVVVTLLLKNKTETN